MIDRYSPLTKEDLKLAVAIMEGSQTIAEPLQSEDTTLKLSSVNSSE